MIEQRFTARDENGVPYARVDLNDFMYSTNYDGITLTDKGMKLENPTCKISCYAIRELARYEDTGLTPPEVDAMIKDMVEIKSCAVCANRDMCDPNGDEEKRRFFCSCMRYEGVVLKNKWEWRGLAGR